MPPQREPVGRITAHGCLGDVTARRNTAYGSRTHRIVSTQLHREQSDELIANEVPLLYCLLHCQRKSRFDATTRLVVAVPFLITVMK